VYGGLLGFLLLQRHDIPRKNLTAIVKSAGIFLVFNLAYGAAKTHVDMAAHLGGFVTGFLAGCALAQPFSATQMSRIRRSAVVLMAGLVISAACATRIPVVDDVDAELKRLDPVETASLKLFNDSLDQLKADKMDEAHFDDVVQKQLLPPWNAEKAALQKLRVSGDQKALVGRLVEYMSLRAEGWSLIAQGVRTNDSALVKQANQKQKQAEDIVNSLNKDSKQ
jgi:rhomboid protease GluP